MKLIIKIIYGLVGVVLLAGYIITGTYGLSETDRQCYQDALAQQAFVNSLGFSQFQLTNYPVAVYTGDKEYVLQGDSVTSRKPVLGVFAGTTYEVDGQYQVFVPSFEDMNQTVGIMSTTAGSSNDYQESSQVATIWHEAFHAWQMSNYMQNIYALTGMDEMSEKLEESIAMLDQDSTYQQAVLREQDILEQALNTSDAAQRKSILSKWAEVVTVYGLSESQAAAVNYYELIEGSAYYVEGKVYAALEGDEAYSAYYLAFSDVCTAGTNKYYTLGMLILIPI